MTIKALAALALMTKLPSSQLLGKTGEPLADVEIDSAWGWHYLLALDEKGVRRRVVGRVSWSGDVAQSYPSEFDLAEDGRETQGFKPTPRMLGVIEAS